MLEKVFEWSSAICAVVVGFFIPPLGAVLGAATPLLSDAVHAADDAVIGNWQKACDSMIAVIAVAMAEKQRTPRRVPTPEPHDIPDRPTPRGPGRRVVTQ